MTDTAHMAPQRGTDHRANARSSLAKRGPLIFLVGMSLLALVFALTYDPPVTETGLAAAMVDTSKVETIQEQPVVFKRGPRGSMLARNPIADKTIYSFSYGETKSIKRVIRSLDRARTAASASGAVPYIVGRTPTGLIVIKDDTRGLALIVNSLGEDTAQHFARLVPTGAAVGGETGEKGEALTNSGSQAEEGQQK